MKRGFCVLFLLWGLALHGRATTYYLSATGNDANSGLTSSQPWLTPNHAVNCGDVILAAPSTAYYNQNFAPGNWGQVTCPAGNNVAWLKCATFDGCKITIPGTTTTQQQGIWVSASYWGVQGWEVNNYTWIYNALGCFGTFPLNAPLHHIIFANNVASTCPLSGISAGIDGGYGTDYVAILGNIVYAGGTYNIGCGANIDVYRPKAYDAAPGTHILIAGNFSYHSVNPANTNCWDGEGIILDTFDNKGSNPPYTQQVVIENNFTLANGGVGVLVEYNSPNDFASGSVPAGVGQSTVYVLNNTMWGNSTGVATSGTYAMGSPDCGEYRAYDIQDTHASGNLLVTNSSQCYGNPWFVNGFYDKPNYALVMNETDATSTASSNWAYSPYGLNETTINSSGFSMGANVFGVDPLLTAPAEPPAPNCSGFADVPHCMAAVVANFTPRNPAAAAYGYQTPSAVASYDPLFPQWLCNVSLPSGLVTMGCATGTSQVFGMTMKGTIRH